MIAAADPVTLHVARLIHACGDYIGADNLNVGCGIAGAIPLPGWSNLDRTPGPGTDIVHDLECMPLPLQSDSLDLVLASHVLEHIVNLIPLMREIHRVLRPGGHLVALTPHASHDSAWEDPTHVRAFTAFSWSYFDSRLYRDQTGHGSYRSPINFDFDVISVQLNPELATWDRLDALKLKGEARQMQLVNWARRERNAISEVIATLRAVK